MKKPPSSMSPILGLSIKRWLIGLNRDLDLILDTIKSTYWASIYYDHSHRAWDEDLSLFLQVTLALEDRRFFDHLGVEPIRMSARLLRRFCKRQRLGGISTIDQQVVRIIRSRYERKFSRKISEIILSVTLNFHATKSEILDYYIHNAYFGYKLEGCEIASKTIFGKACSSLDLDEAATLSAALARPFPKSVVVAMSFFPQEARNLDLLRSVIKAHAPIYGENLFRRSAYGRAVLIDRFKSRLTKKE